MSEAIYDPCAYTRLNDSVVHQILVSSDPELEEVCSGHVTPAWIIWLVGHVIDTMSYDIGEENLAKDWTEGVIQVSWTDTNGVQNR